MAAGSPGGVGGGGAAAEIAKLKERIRQRRLEQEVERTQLMLDLASSAAKGSSQNRLDAIATIEKMRAQAQAEREAQAAEGQATAEAQPQRPFLPTQRVEPQAPDSTIEPTDMTDLGPAGAVGGQFANQQIAQASPVAGGGTQATPEATGAPGAGAPPSLFGMPINPLQVRSTTQEVSAPRTLPSGVTLPFRTGQTTTTVEPNQLSAADAATLLYRMAKDRTDTHRRDMKLLADSALDPAATPEDQSITLREYMRLSPEDRATVDSFVGQGRAKFNQRLATGFTLGTAWNAEQRGLVPAGTYEALKEGARRGQSISIDMTQGTKTELEKQANAISGMRDNVYSILKRWDPNKHAGLNNLLKNRWFTVRDFAGGVPILGEAIGGPLTEEQRAGLQEYVNIRGDMVRTLSDTILARGGTAMTANEEKIIKGFSASPGQSPAEIEANLLTALTIGDVVLGRRALWNLNGQKTPSGRPVEEPWEITELDLANTIVSMVAAEMDQLSESNPDLEGADLHRFATDKVEQQLNLLPGGSQRILRKQGLLRRREE